MFRRNALDAVISFDMVAIFAAATQTTLQSAQLHSSGLAMSHGTLQAPGPMIKSVFDMTLTPDMVDQLIRSATCAVEDGWPSEWYAKIVHEGVLYSIDLAELVTPSESWMLAFNHSRVPLELTASCSFGRAKREQ